MKRCPKCGEENPDRFRLCGFCGTSLAVELPVQPTRKMVTVVFCDLKGSTTLGEKLDSESLREVLSHYFQRMRLVLESHGGSVEKYIGDAIMAVFGIPRAHEDDALRAVRAADEMRHSLMEVNEQLARRWGVALQNRTGVNTGEVVAGDVTTGQRLVTGDTVNVAARLEQAAPENEVLISQSTYRLVRGFVEVEALEPLELKGKAEPVPAYRLLSTKPVSHEIGRQPDIPMVGRAQELSLLIGRWHRARESRRCQLITVVGHAGVGKSRLIHEFAQQIGGEATVLRARCLSYGEGITFLPLVDVVRKAAGIAPNDSPDDSRAKLAALGTDSEVYQRLASMIGLVSETYLVEEMFWAARKLFESLASERPLLVVFDDIHWAEPTFLDLIEDLHRSIRDASIVILCSARHELLEQRAEWSSGEDNAEWLELKPLGEEESAMVVRNLLGEGPVAEEVQDRISRVSEGNPLFVEQMLSMLVDEGLLARDQGGRWAAASELGSFSMPASISALLTARLDRLGDEERAVIERGAVVGHLFYRGAVIALSPEQLQELVSSSLSSLARKEMIRPDVSDLAGEEAHRFQHALIRDAAYQGLLKRVRIEFHEAVAEWLQLAAGSLVEFEEIVGYHLEQAYRYRTELGVVDELAREVGQRAAQRLAAAGRRAFVRGDMPAAINLLERATSVLDQDEPMRAALIPDFAEALDARGDFARAEQLLGDAIESAVRRGDKSQEMEAAVVRALVRNSTGPTGQSSELLREAEIAIPVLEEAKNQSGLARAWRLVAFVHGTAGRYGAAQEALDQVIENARWAGDLRQEGRSLANYGWCALYGPMPVPEAIDRCEQLLSEATGDRQSESLLRCALAQLCAMQGEFDKARELVRHGRSVLGDLGEVVLGSSRSLDAARIELMSGDAVAAEEVLRADYEALDSMGERYFLSGVAGLLAHALYVEGRYEEAETFSRVSETWGGEDAEDQALWRRARAKVYARWGRKEEAQALVWDAVKLVDSTDSPVLQANTLLDLAEVLMLCGHPALAVPHVLTGLSLFERKGSVVSASRAREMLDRIAADSAVAAQPGSHAVSGASPEP